MSDERCTRSMLRAALVAICAGGSLPAMATNGYFSHGYGATSKAMAGVGAAMPVDTLASAVNPAGLIQVGDRIDVGLAYFSPDRGYSVSGQPSGACLSAQQCTFGVGPESLESDAGLFLIPHFGYSRRVGEDAVIGIAVYGNGGMNTRSVGGSATFGAPMQTVPPGVPVTMQGTFGDGTAGVDLAEIFVTPSYARRIGGLSLGIAPVFAAQRFEARGLGALAPFSSNPDKLTDNGHEMSYGYGMRIGVQTALSERISVGAAYQSRIWMSKFDDYSGLFAEQGDFDIPASATIGIAAKMTDTFTLAFDMQWIGYGDIAAVANPMLPNLMLAQLGADDGAGFGWENMTIYKLGAEWRSSGGGTWRFGYSDTEQPIKPSDVLFNILAPGVVERHFTFGYARRTAGGNEWSIAGMYAPSTSVRGPNALDPAQTIELSMKQYEIGIGFAFGR